jgi:hypothetical protein
MFKLMRDMPKSSTKHLSATKGELDILVYF